MTDVAERRWGHSFVRAPMAREAVPPGDVGAPVTPARTTAPPTGTRRAFEPGGDETAAWPAVRADRVQPPAADRVQPPAAGPERPPPRAPAAAAAPVGAMKAPSLPGSSTKRPVLPPKTPDDIAARLGQRPPRAVGAPAPPTVAATDGGQRGPDPRAPAAGAQNAPKATAPAAPDEQSLARLARGVQDCARAVSCLADRLDVLERRSVTTPALSPPAGSRNGDGARQSARVEPPARDGLDARVRALEGMADDRLHALDQRLRKLEALPATVGRLQKDTAWLTELATTRRVEEAVATRMATAAELTPVYQELDRVAEMVAAQHAAATQSLERVRTLERAVLEMRRYVERNLADHTRSASSEQAAVQGRIEALEACLAVGPSSDTPH